MYAWIDEACIDQETWAKYPDVGMSYVYGESQNLCDAESLLDPPFNSNMFKFY